MMEAKEYRIIYLALLADYEKTNREIEMISGSVKGPRKLVLTTYLLI